jgi:hypothetical protein
MFGVRYWCDRFFAGRFWPKVGSDQVHTVGRILVVPQRRLTSVPRRVLLRVPTQE